MHTPSRIYHLKKTSVGIIRLAAMAGSEFYNHDAEFYNHDELFNGVLGPH
jgi:hypothetical protein